MSHKQQMCYPRRQCTHGCAASMLEQEQWVQPGITQCQLQHLTMPHKQPVCHLRMQRVPTCMTEAVVVHRCFCRSHAHCWRMSHMTLESSLLVALCAVLYCRWCNWLCYRWLPVPEPACRPCLQHAQVENKQAHQHIRYGRRQPHGVGTCFPCPQAYAHGLASTAMSACATGHYIMLCMLLVRQGPPSLAAPHGVHFNKHPLVF